jgi:hypothetical protein
MSRACASLAHRSCYWRTDVRVHVLWFGEDRHQAFAYPRDQCRFVLVDQRDIERLFGVLKADQEKVRSAQQCIAP